jgi:hypothetical protein
MSVTANLTTNVETITATIVVEDETIIAQVSAAARGPAGEPGAAGPAGATGPAGPNTVTTATTTNLTGFISGNGTNIAGATAAATAATANTLVLRDGSGGASLSTITLSGTGGSPFTSTLTGGVNFANRTLVLPDVSGTLVTAETLANSATITASTAVAVDTIVLRDGAGVINITSSNVAGTTAYASTAGWTYAGSAASAHRTALGLGTGDSPTFAGATFEGLIEQRNGNAAQESRIYGTYTGPGNYRRLALKMSTAGVAQIVAEGGGAGASGNRLELPSNTIFASASATRVALGLKNYITLDQDATRTSDIVASEVAMLSSANHPEGLSVFGFSVAANECVSFEFILHTTDASSPRNQRYEFTLPAAHTGLMLNLRATAPSSTATYNYGAVDIVVNSLSSATNGGMVVIQGTIQNGANAGNVVLKLRQQTSSANTIAIKKGSSLEVKR